MVVFVFLVLSFWARSGPGTKPNLSQICLIVPGPHKTISHFTGSGLDLGRGPSCGSELKQGFGPEVGQINFASHENSRLFNLAYHDDSQVQYLH